tara:strand:+ start:454 stop:1332 length:879 start_codon:yes stop_codon:yes gene_type:complete
MKTLLLGSSGQLGKNLVTTCPREFQLQSLNRSELDILNYEDLRNKILEFKPDYIINATGYTNVEKAETNQSLAYNINQKGINNIVKIINEVNSTIIHFSTDYVFDGKKNGSYNELDHTNPISVYGKSKLFGENEIINQTQKYLIFRISWLYSEEQNNFIWKVFNFSNENQDIYKIVNDQKGIPTYAKELSFNIWEIMKDSFLSKKFGIYHYCDKGKASTWFEIAIFISDYMTNKGYNFPKILPCSSDDYKSVVNRPKNSCFDTQKINKTFCLKQNNWKDNMNKVLNSYIGKL